MTSKQTGPFYGFGYFGRECGVIREEISDFTDRFSWLYVSLLHIYYAFPSLFNEKAYWQI